MDVNGLLLEGFGRVAEALPAVVKGLDTDDLLWRPDPGANSMAWLLWHLARCEDAQMAPLVDREQLWTSGQWVQKFQLPYSDDAMGYGQSAHEVGAFMLDDPHLLTGYYAAVHERSVEIITGLRPADLDVVIDTRWDPPVTVGVRLLSVLNDITQHLGQAAYVRGLRQRSLRPRPRGRHD